MSRVFLWRVQNGGHVLPTVLSRPGFSHPASKAYRPSRLDPPPRGGRCADRRQFHVSDTESLDGERVALTARDHSRNTSGEGEKSFLVKITMRYVDTTRPESITLKFGRDLRTAALKKFISSLRWTKPVRGLLEMSSCASRLAAGCASLLRLLTS